MGKAYAVDKIKVIIETPRRRKLGEFLSPPIAPADTGTPYLQPSISREVAACLIIGAALRHHVTRCRYEDR